jgi:hypothetical protein
MAIYDMDRFRSRLELDKKIDSFAYLALVDPLDPTSINPAIDYRVKSNAFEVLKDE